MVTIEPIATPTIDSMREALPGLQQNIEDVFANFKVDPWLGVHGGRDVYEHDREDKEQREPPGPKPLWHYLKRRHPDGRLVFLSPKQQGNNPASNDAQGGPPQPVPSGPNPAGLNYVA